MHTTNEYLNASLRQLRDQQVRVAPAENKLQQAARGEKLLEEIDSARTYSFEYLCYRLTHFRPESAPLVTMAGAEARHDLRLYVEDVSDAANVRAEDAGEVVHTAEDLSRRFKVSTKTISRWRDQGLVARRFVFNDGRKRVGFLNSSVERFVHNNRDRVQRGARFTQLSDQDREEIVERARRMARAGGCPAEIVRRIAKHMDRSPETIRYTLKQFDAKHPSAAVFRDQTGPLSDEVKQKVYNQFRRGTSAEALAKRYCRTKSSIYRVINEMRARRLRDLPLEYIPNETFDRSGVEKEILGPMPDSETSKRKSNPPSNLPLYLASLYETPLLTREQEYHLFRKFNYLKHKASKLREKLDPAAAKTNLMDKIEALYDQAVRVKNEIIQANLRLVVSIAKRHVTGSEDFFHLVSDGNMSLIRAVEKFDFSRGNKFSTYATWAIMKNYARSIPDEFRQRDRFRTSSEEAFGATEDERSDRRQQETEHQLRKAQIIKILDRLDEREQKIIVSRFGLDYTQEPRTLKQVGEEIGVTKERVRQIEARALNKLRLAAKEEHIEFLEDE